MDFIELWFGISPDGGNGAVEVVCLVAVAAGVAALVGLGRRFPFGRRWFARAQSSFQAR
jgi:hypothetical protein